MIHRIAKIRLKSLARQFRVVAINGPRQSGKSTLVRECFPNKDYISLEDPDKREFATRDPRGFLAPYVKKGVILDEVQRVPELFSYMQGIVDDQQKAGQFILTGSNNFLMQENISQSLAGRVAYLTLLPLTLKELKDAGKLNPSDDEVMFRGFYPEVHSKRVKPSDWYSNYIQTYLERDVRKIKNIENYRGFSKLLVLCAGRTGQLFNMNALAIECGVDIKTIQSWVSVLEYSYVIFFLRPYHVNYNKRIVKMPKLYFHDTGLACSLLGIPDSKSLSSHHLRGALFENLVIADMLKANFNVGGKEQFYFWRDKTGQEIDLLVELSGKPSAIEIKSGQTFSPEFAKHLYYWQKVSKQKKNATIIYAGNQEMNFSDGIKLTNFRNILC